MSAAPVPPGTLILDPVVVKMIASAQGEGRLVYLASSAGEDHSATLIEHLRADGSLASGGRDNFADEARTQKRAARSGQRGYDYIGNECRQLTVWRRAWRAIAINVSPALAERVRASDLVAEVVPRSDSRWRNYLKALRPRWHVWILAGTL